MTYESRFFDRSMIGCAVYTCDGNEVGHVKDVQGGFFKVDAPMQPDYWLSRDAVSTATPAGVTLVVDKDRLDDCKLDLPGDFAGGSAVRGDKGAAAALAPSPTSVGQAPIETNATPAYTPLMRSTWDEVGPSYRQSWEQQYSSAGLRWEAAEPGYRYGYEMAGESRYHGRDWNDIEPELRSGYADWSQRHGYPYDEGTWGRIKENVREAWNKVRGRDRLIQP